MLLGIILAIIFLSILILVHELGHFWAAKKFGLLIEEFGIGLPPRIWGKKIGETIYSVNALPIGGFVKIFGEDGKDSLSEQSELHPNIPNNTRIIEAELSYKLTGLFFQTQNQLGRFAREKQYGDVLENLLKESNIRYKRELPVSVENYDSNKIDFFIDDKVILELKSKRFIDKSDYYQTKRYLDSMNLELGLIVNFREPHLKPKRVLNPKIRKSLDRSDLSVDLDGIRSFGLLSIWKRAVVISAGVLMNFLIGWMVVSLVFFIGVPGAIFIAEVFKGSPAEEIGLIAGDKISGFDNLKNFIAYVDQNRGKEIVLNVERGGKQMDFKTTPRENPPAGQGAIGVSLIEAGSPKQDLIPSVWNGLTASFNIIKATFAAFYNLIANVFVGKASLDAVTGPVGIVKIINQASDLGIVYLLQLLALISLNLAVLNILPFPAVDGGRLMFLIFEKIKGSPLPVKFERYANGLGMALLLLLMLIITIKDITRLW
ncbi:RIP metalloprotease RseP [Candidatus Wolfebacteria bacterium]|nr:RIP metalloprotease RseP [Candidatus Wolfebacteria bacterium]